MGEPARIEFVGTLAAVDVRPGDRFVLRSAVELSREETEAVADGWKLWIAGLEPAPALLILGPGLVIELVRAEDQVDG